MWKSPWLPRIVFAACLAPLVWLAWLWYQHRLGINQTEFVARYTGATALRLLLLCLAITPLRRLPGLAPLARFRRMLGLFAFFYGTLHGLHYFQFDAQWNGAIIREDLTFRRFFIAGMAAWALMVPLAATSFDRAIRWMGGARWRLLHRLVYVSALAGVIHYTWQAKILTLEALQYAAVLAILMAARIPLWLPKRKAKPKPQVRPVTS